MNDYIYSSLKTAKRAIIFIIGATVVLIGVAMVVLPGPAVIVIPLGLAILATEFVWAKKLLKKAKDKFQNNNKKRGNNNETN